MMANLKDTLSDPLYKNWVKAGLALKITRAGIEAFVKDKVNKIHQTVLHDIWQGNSIPTGTICTNCDTNQIIRGSGCPVGICHEIRVQIEHSHRYNQPSWKNTTVKQWGTSDWELAKAYMSPDGYQTVSSAAETDFTGLVNVVINHKDFQNWVADNLSSKSNIFVQARTTRNTILHSSTFQVTDTELNSYIDTMENILKDAKYLATDQYAIDAIDKLTQIRNGFLSVTEEDETRIRAEALKIIEEKKQESVKKVQECGQQEIENIYMEKKIAVKDIENKGKEMTEKLYEEKQTAVTDIETKAQEEIDQLIKEKQTAVKEIETKGNEEREQIKEGKKSAVRAIEAKGIEQRCQMDEGKQTAIKDIESKAEEQRKQIDEEKQTAIKYIETKGEQQSDQMDKEKHIVFKDIVSKGKEQRVQIEKEKQMAVKDIESKSNNEIKRMKETGTLQIDAFRQEKDDIKKKLQTEKEKTITAIQIAGVTEAKTLNKTAVKHLETIRHQTDGADMESHMKDPEQVYIASKKGLQRYLTNIYKDCCLATPIYPLEPDEDSVNIADVYVKPCMQRVEYPKTPTEQPADIVKSYHDIFYKGSKLCKKIYVTGNAGMGKSTLCQKILHLWCKAHQERNVDYCLSKDEATMQQFDFFFYISLRCACDESTVEEMIKKQLLHHETSQKLLSELFEDESIQCLIVLDGLDEWAPPKHYQASRFVSKGLPGRKLTPNCTILTTSRPWKLEVVRIKPTEIDQNIELTGMDLITSKELINAVVTLLNKKHSRNLKAMSFSAELRKKHAEEFRTIPVTLKQLICMWHEGKPLGETPCHIYSGMIDLLLEMADAGFENNEDITRLKEEWSESGIQLPVCFDGKVKSLKYRPLLLALGRMAFETLFNTNRESSLVFESSEAELYGLSKTEIEICLKVGILSQSKVFGGCSSRKKSLSFLHKTFQEFLAALFISVSTNDIDKLILQIFSICSSLDRVLEMSKVFEFVSGMLPKAARLLSEYICDVASRDSRVQGFRKYITTPYCKWTAGIVKQVRSLIQECVSQSNDVGLKLEDFIIQYNTDLDTFELMLTKNQCSVKSLDIESMLKFSNSLQEVITQLVGVQKIVVLDFINYDILNEMLQKSQQTLRSLRLGIKGQGHKNELSTDQFYTMLDSLPYLESLSLDQMRLPHQQLESLMSFLSQRTQMRQIELQCLSCKNCKDECRYQLNLSQDEHLEILKLERLHVEKVEINTMAMEVCSIEWLKKSDAVSSILRCLHSAPKLQKLRCFKSNISEDIDALLATLPTLAQLKELDLNEFSLGDRELKLSPVMKNIEIVSFDNVTMTTRSLRSFFGSIPHTKHSIEVKLRVRLVSELRVIWVSAKEEVSRELNFIRSSPRVTVTEDRSGSLGHRLNFKLGDD